jgi:hypothetical protein
MTEGIESKTIIVTENRGMSKVTMWTAIAAFWDSILPIFKTTIKTFEAERLAQRRIY